LIGTSPRVDADPARVPPDKLEAFDFRGENAEDVIDSDWPTNLPASLVEIDYGGQADPQES